MKPLQATYKQGGIINSDCLIVMMALFIFLWRLASSSSIKRNDVKDFFLQTFHGNLIVVLIITIFDQNLYIQTI